MDKETNKQFIKIRPREFKYKKMQIKKNLSKKFIVNLKVNHQNKNIY